MAILPILISASYHISTDSIMHAKMPGWQDLTFGILDQCAIILSYSLISLLARSYEALLQTRSINQRLRLQSEQVEHNSQLIEQIRKDKHELKNIFFYIGMLLKEHKYNDLENYVTGTLETRYDRLEEFHTGNNMLDLLLTQKVHEARSYGIRVMANILVPADLPIEGDDLCGLLINLLDNAIDASRKESESEIQINIDQKQSYLCIYVRNRAHADTLKSNPHLHTTKKDEASHGIGLSVIRSIVKKYNGIYQVSMDNGYFETDIMLSMNK